LRYVRSILQNKDTRKVFFFLLLNLTFTLIEFLYGFITNSLGLTADAVHMLFDSTAIICSLIASVITKREATNHYTYGFGRVETMTGFVNALLLVFASFHIIWEAIERFYQPEIKEAQSLLVVSILGFLVNLVGIFAFDHGGVLGSHHGHDHGGCMFLHVLSDTLGSVGVIVSTLLILMFGWTWTDPLCSIFIAILTIFTTWPLLKSAGNTLLQRIPPHIDLLLSEAESRILSIPGVASTSPPHLWELNQGNIVSSIKVMARPGADEGKIRLEVAAVHKELFGVRNCTIQVD
ncbi:hypothetical protein BATDEDRAFT_4771, partial [Batrachochytrium dendrobatidis JAM81]